MALQVSAGGGGWVPLLRGEDGGQGAAGGDFDDCSWLVAFLEIRFIARNDAPPAI